MIHDIQLRTDPATASSPDKIARMAAQTANVADSKVTGALVRRRSIDARQRRVMVNLSVRLYIDEPMPEHPLATPETYLPLPENAPQALVVGAGPAGLFAALRLVQLGIRPIILERGKDVDSRRADMAAIARRATVDPNSNYCFGEGGAGAYSDGKLYTRSTKRGCGVDKILNILHQHGAADNVLIEAHPHIGTDRLPGIIKAIRHTLLRCGAEVHFRTKVTSLIVANGIVSGVNTADAKTYHGPVILATGHSARDVYHFLSLSGAPLEAKGIAVGCRLEHPQKLIDQIRYHSSQGRGKHLPPAEYTVLTRIDNRAVYSFCMCPGGVIIPAASEPHQMVVNGMSGSTRSGRWANSGMVVEVLPEDIPGNDPLRMMHFQEDIEHVFFADSGTDSYNAPAQRMTDFVAGRPSSTLPDTSYAPGIHPARIDKLLPKHIASRLQRGLEELGRKHRGFLTPEAVLIGNETRTSAPVKIPRHHETLECISLPGLFPCGEGAGYAGGIVSAAIDGDSCAEAVARYLAK